MLWQFHYVRRVFLVRAFNTTAETVNAIMAIPTDTRAALLNSGTFGVEVAPVDEDVLGLDVNVGVGLGVEVPLDGSDTTARLPMRLIRTCIIDCIYRACSRIKSYALDAPEVTVSIHCSHQLVRTVRKDCDCRTVIHVNFTFVRIVCYGS